MNISFLNIPAETPDEPVTEYLSQFPDMVGNALHIQKDHVGIPYYTGTQVYQVNRLYQHLPRYINDMLGRSVLCIYNNQLTDQSSERNNTNRSHYHRERTTDRYSTQNERNTNNDNQSDSESENQQQQQEPNTTTTNKTQQENHAEIRELQPQETTNTHQQQKNVTIRRAKTTPTTQYHINKEPPLKTTDNYPEIQKTTPTTENKRSTSPLQKNAQSNITTIPETQIVSETQTQEATQLSFLSPSMVTKTQNQIPSSTPDTTNSEILKECKNYFQNLYTKQNTCEITQNLLLQHISNEITNEQNNKLTKQIEITEIKEAIRSMENDKSPGIDGIPIKFYKEFTETIKRLTKNL